METGKPVKIKEVVIRQDIHKIIQIGGRYLALRTHQDLPLLCRRNRKRRITFLFSRVFKYEGTCCFRAVHIRMNQDAW